MVYVNEDIQNYKYLVSVSDNYIILSKDSFANGDYMSPDTIDVVYQFFEPNFQTIKTTLSISRQQDFPNISSQFTTDLGATSNYPNLIICSLLVVFVLMFIFNGLTRIVKKSGIIFN